MFDDVTAFLGFYQTRQGRSVRSVLTGYTDPFWGRNAGAQTGAGGEQHAAIGYALPFMQDPPTGLILMPMRHGATRWPTAGPVRSSLVDPHNFPLQDVQLDRLLMVHALEFDDHPSTMLAEAWRSLDGAGRLMVIVPHRMGLWAQAERTPFGHGRPFSGRQLRQLLTSSGFEVSSVRSALFAPPTAGGWILQMAPAIERLGRRWIKPAGGVLVAEARKMLYAPAGNTSKLRAAKGLKSAGFASQSSRIGSVGDR